MTTIKDDGLNSTEGQIEVTKERVSWIKKIFKNRYDHFRAIWRMLFYFVIVIVPMRIISLIIRSIFKSGGDSVGADEMLSFPSILRYCVTAIILLLAAWIVLRWVDRRPFDVLGIHFSRRGIQDFSVGYAMGMVILMVIFSILWAFGFLKVEYIGIQNVLLSRFWLVFFFLFVAALIEELLMRGYMFQALCEGTRIWIAILLFNVLFSLGHWNNPDYVWTSALSIFILGLLCAVVYIKTRSLWTATGLHMAWNWTQGSVFGMKVSGIEVPHSIFKSLPTGPDVLSGGEFGGEGSLITSFVPLILLFILLRIRWPKPDKEVIEAWNRYPAGWGLDPKTPNTENEAVKKSTRKLKA